MVEFESDVTCSRCGYTQTLNSYLQSGNYYFVKCDNCHEYYGIDMPENEKIVTERCLTFNIAGERQTYNAVTIANLLVDNNIDYVGYFNEHRPKFIVRRSGKKWEDIMRLINTVYAPKYDYEKQTFHTTNRKREGVLGNLQPIVIC
jgi:transcription elongation factor Elf1